MKKSLRVLSCIPKQLHTFGDKLSWVETQITTHKPDVIALSQEFHGGIQTLLFKPNVQQLAYEPHQIIDPYLELSKKHGVGIVVGGLVDDPNLNERRERTYIFDPEKGVTGYVDKSILPGYDHIDANSRTKVYPEWNLQNRAQAFDLCGARVSILYCWEAMSTHIWHAIARAQPDILITPIKFGVNGWPAKKEKNAAGETIFTGFGYGKDGGWLECLRLRAKWDLACPVICSTNSWDLPNKAGALCGQILPWEEKETTGQWARHERHSSLWNTALSLKEIKDKTYESLKPSAQIEERVQVDDVDYLYWRYIRDHKFTMFDQIQEWPSSEAREMTMRWKVMRMERNFLGIPKLMCPASKKPKAEKGLHKKIESVLE